MPPGGGVKNTPRPSDKNSPTQETARQKTGDNTVNGVVKGGEGSNIQKLQDLDQPQEKTAYVAQYVLDELGDTQSRKFYALVLLCQILSEHSFLNDSVVIHHITAWCRSHCATSRCTAGSARRRQSGRGGKRVAWATPFGLTMAVVQL